MSNKQVCKTTLTGNVNQLLQIGNLRIPILDVIRYQLVWCVQPAQESSVLDDLEIETKIHSYTTDWSEGNSLTHPKLYSRLVDVTKK